MKQQLPKTTASSFGVWILHEATITQGHCFFFWYVDRSWSNNYQRPLLLLLVCGSFMKQQLPKTIASSFGMWILHEATITKEHCLFFWYVDPSWSNNYQRPLLLLLVCGSFMKQQLPKTIASSFGMWILHEATITQDHCFFFWCVDPSWSNNYQRPLLLLLVCGSFMKQQLPKTTASSFGMWILHEATITKDHCFFFWYVDPSWSNNYQRPLLLLLVCGSFMKQQLPKTTASSFGMWILHEATITKDHCFFFWYVDPSWSNNYQRPLLLLLVCGSFMKQQLPKTTASSFGMWILHEATITKDHCFFFWYVDRPWSNNYQRPLLLLLVCGSFMKQQLPKTTATSIGVWILHEATITKDHCFFFWYVDRSWSNNYQRPLLLLLVCGSFMKQQLPKTIASSISVWILHEATITKDHCFFFWCVDPSWSNNYQRPLLLLLVCGSFMKQQLPKTTASSFGMWILHEATIIKDHCFFY